MQQTTQTQMSDKLTVERNGNVWEITLNPEANETERMTLKYSTRNFTKAQALKIASTYET